MIQNLLFQYFYLLRFRASNLLHGKVCSAPVFDDLEQLVLYSLDNIINPVLLRHIPGISPSTGIFEQPSFVLTYTRLLSRLSCDNIVNCIRY